MDPRAEAARLAERGFPVTPLAPGSKRPVGRDWASVVIPPAQVGLYFKENSNVGIICGQPGPRGALVCVDLDAPTAQRLAPWLLEFLPTEMVEGRRGGLASHLWYMVTDAVPESRAFTAPAGLERGVIVEILGRGRCAAVPPSRFEDGGERVWFSAGEPGEVYYQDLVAAVSYLAAAALLAEYWKPGIRERAALALAGAFWYAGRPHHDALRFMRAVVEAAGDEEREKRLRCVDDTYDDSDKNRTGLPTLYELFPREVIARVVSWLDLRRERPPEAEEPAAERKSERAKLIEALVDLVAKEVEIFETDSDRIFVRVRKDDGLDRYWPLDDKDFADWLVDRAWQTTRQIPRDEHVRAVLRLLRAQDHPRRQVFLRCARVGQTVYVYSRPGEIYEITPTGWRAVPTCPVPFVTLRTTLPLPTPVKGGSVEVIRRFLNVSDEDWAIVKIWLISAFNTNVTFPLLALLGFQGSGKTIAAETLKSLIDPSAQGSRTQPTSVRDLCIAAESDYVLFFNNISELDPEISDALCGVVEGTNFTTRALFTDRREVIIRTHNPVLVTAVDDVITRPDLRDRAFVIQLNPVEDSARIAEDRLRAEREAVLGQALGGLFEAVVVALQREKTLAPPASLPRLAGTARWAMAAAPALGLDEKEVLGLMLACRQEAAHRFVDTDPFLNALTEYLGEQLRMHGGKVVLPTVQIFEGVKHKNPMDETFPRSVQAVGQRLARLGPALAAVGIKVARDSYRRGGAVWRFEVV